MHIQDPGANSHESRPIGNSHQHSLPDEMVGTDYVTFFSFPKYSKKWALNPFPGSNWNVSILDGREPSWICRKLTSWILGFEWIDISKKD